MPDEDHEYLTTDKLVSLDQATVAPGTMMCCVEHGVNRVVTVDCVATFQGMPVTWTMLLSLDGAKRLGQSLVDTAEAG